MKVRPEIICIVLFIGGGTLLVCTVSSMVQILAISLVLGGALGMYGGLQDHIAFIIEHQIKEKERQLETASKRFPRA